MVSAATAADTFVEDTYVEPQFGLIEFLRRIREDQLSVLNPELFSRNMTYARLLFLDHFLIIKPEYIEHVLLTNHANYRKSHFLRAPRGAAPRQRAAHQRGRILAAPASHRGARVSQQAHRRFHCHHGVLQRGGARTLAHDDATLRHCRRDDGADAQYHLTHNVLAGCQRRR